MTHDPLCYCAANQFADDEFCQCDLIARVRADERGKAVLVTAKAVEAENERMTLVTDDDCERNYQEGWHLGFAVGTSEGRRQGQRDEREACIAAVEAVLSWEESNSESTFLAIDRQAAIAAIRAREGKP